MPASIINGIFGNQAANTQATAATQAAAMSQASADKAIALQQQIFNQQQQNQAPWLAAGTAALGQLAQGMATPESAYMKPFSMADYTADPGYAFRQQQGMNALQNSAAARGGLLSGNTLKGIQDYSQGLASEEYQNAFNRYQTNQGNQFNRLASVAGLGQTANTALNTAGSNYAGNVGNISMNNAATIGNAALASGQARASSLQGMGNALGSTNWGNVMNMFGSNSTYNPNSGQAPMSASNMAAMAAWGGY